MLLLQAATGGATLYWFIVTILSILAFGAAFTMGRRSKQDTSTGYKRHVAAINEDLEEVREQMEALLHSGRDGEGANLEKIEDWDEIESQMEQHRDHISESIRDLDQAASRL